MVCTKPSITGINCGAVKQMINQLLQDLLQKMVSLALIPSSTSTVKVTTKWTATNVLIGVTISIKSGMVENNRSSLMVEYINVSFSIYMLFAHQYIVATK